MPRIILLSIGGILVLCLAWLAWPAPIDPAYWDEPAFPAMTGALEPNDDLAAVEILQPDGFANAEDMAFAADGSIYMGTLFGNLQRMVQDPATGDWSVDHVMEVSDRALLGIQWIDDETLAIAAIDGLYAANVRTREVRTLSTGSPARPFGFVNDVEVGPDGTVYFSDSTVGWSVLDYAVTPFRTYELMENRPHGLIYAIDAQGGQTRVVLERLHYPNGLSMSSDGQALFIAETTRFTIRRLELSGPNAGQLSVLAENLPGPPDGIRSDGRGHLFVAILGPRRPLVRFMHRNPWATWILFKLGYRPALSPAGEGAFVVVIDETSGEIVDSFQGGEDHVTSIANVIPRADGQLWLASDGETYLGWMDLPERFRAASAHHFAADQGE